MWTVADNELTHCACRLACFEGPGQSLGLRVCINEMAIFGNCLWKI